METLPLPLTFRVLRRALLVIVFPLASVLCPACFLFPGPTDPDEPGPEDPQELEDYLVSCALDLTSVFGSDSLSSDSTCVPAGSPGEAEHLGEFFCDGVCEELESDEIVEFCTVRFVDVDEDGCRSSIDADSPLRAARAVAASHPGYHAEFSPDHGLPGEVTLRVGRDRVDLPFEGRVRFSLTGCPGPACTLTLDAFGFLLAEDVKVRTRTIFGGPGGSTRMQHARAVQAERFDPATGRFTFPPGSLPIYAHWSRDRVRPGRVHEAFELGNDSPLEGVLDLAASPPTISLSGDFGGSKRGVGLDVAGRVTERPPVAVLTTPSEVECNVLNPDDPGTFVDLDASASSDPDDDIVGYLWTLDGEPRTSNGPGISNFFDLGTHELSLVAFDRRLAASEPARATLEMRDTEPPIGIVTSPAECECFGPDAIPVEITDSFRDLCGSEVSREYAPGAGPYTEHGDHRVTVTARDAGGRAASAVRNFTIDRVAPRLEVRSPRPVLYASLGELPIPIDFFAEDADGARGGVAHEQVLLDGAVLLDGDVFGDADGRLGDEVSTSGAGRLSVGLDSLCAGGANGDHVLTVSARDCGGNVAARSVSFSVLLPPDACAAAVPRSLVVNEVDYDQGEDDVDEFIEVKNIGTSPVDLADYALRVYYYGPFESQPRFARYDRYPMEGVVLEAGDYFVLCTDGNPGDYCDQRVTPSGWGSHPTELLRETSPAAVALVYNLTWDLFLDRVVDGFCYIGSETPGDPGGGIPGALPGGSLTETLCNSQIETEPLAGVSRVPDGRDSDDNQADLRQACATPGAENRASVRCDGDGRIGRLLINELDVNQPEHPDTAEFVEIFNAGDVEVVLSEYLLVHRFLDPLRSFYPVEDRLRLPDSTLGPGDYFVVCGGSEVPGCEDDRLFPLYDASGVVAIVHNVTGAEPHDRLLDAFAYGAPGPAFEGGPSGGGRWTEGAPFASQDGEHSVGGGAGIGYSRRCRSADTDGSASDFALAPITPGGANENG